MGSSQTRDRTCVSCTDRWILYHWATREVPRCVFFDLLFSPLTVIFVMFLSAVVCSCIIFCYMNTLPCLVFSLRLTLNGSLDYMQLVFCYRQQCCYEHSCMWLLGPMVKSFSRVISGFKVYTFSTCLDNAKLIFQRDSSFPYGPKPQSLFCSSSSSSRPVGKELCNRAREKPVSLYCSDPYFWAQEVTGWPGQPGKSPLVAWLESLAHKHHSESHTERSKLCWPKAKKANENQTNVWIQHSA